MTEENMSIDKTIDPSSEEKNIYILDTNILLHEPFASLSFQEHDVVVPMTVLEELDPNIDLGILTGPAGCGKTGITSTKTSIFVQTSVKIKSLAQFLQRNFIKNSSLTHRISTSSKLTLGECYA